MDDSESDNLLDVPEVETYKLYPKRWFILAIYVLIVMSNITQTPEYVSVTETILKYYDSSIEVINWSTMINLLMVVISIFPSTFFIQKMGLRNSVVMSAIGTAASAWIKVAGVAPNRFWVVILGQALNAVFQTILIIIPPKLAAVWFGAKEISTACSIGIIAAAMANAVGFLIPTSVLKNANFFEIERGLYLINTSYAVVPSFLVLISFCWFSERPPTSPTRAQGQIEDLSFPVQNFGESIKALLTNPSFMFLTVVYMLNAGIFNAFPTMLNPLIIKHYPHATQEVGIIGLVMYTLGGFGLITTGVLLDRFGQYKLFMWIISLSLLASSVLLRFLISKGMYFVYILSGLYGFLFNGFLLMCIQLGVELTYPQPENNIAGIQAIGGQSFGLVFTYLYTFLLSNCNELVTNLIFTGIMAFADVFLLFVKFNLKRQSLLRIN